MPQTRELPAVKGNNLRVVLADDHGLVRAGVRAVLEPQPDIEVVGEAASAPAAIAEAERCRPDVLIMDIQMPGGSGVEATREIRARHPETKVLMLTSFGDDEALFASIMAGASGYVLKEIDGPELIRAVRMVGQGKSLLDPTVTAAVLQRLRDGRYLQRDERLARLSGQEERVLALLATGKTNRQIAAEVSLSDKTVKNYVSAILGKLEVERRTEAAAYLASHGRDDPPRFRQVAGPAR